MKLNAFGMQAEAQPKPGMLIDTQSKTVTHIDTNGADFAKLKVGDQVIAVRGYALRTNENSPAPGDRGFVVDDPVMKHGHADNVFVKFFGFDKVFDFSPKYLQKISNSQPVCDDEYARSTAKAREWLFKRGYHLYGSTTTQLQCFGLENGPEIQLESLLAMYQADIDAEFDPTECGPSLKWQIEHLKLCLDSYRKEYKEWFDKYHNDSVTEIGAVNKNVAEYVRHWESRVHDAEHRAVNAERRAGKAEQELEVEKIISNTLTEKLENAETVNAIYRNSVFVMDESNQKLKKELEQVKVLSAQRMEAEQKQKDRVDAMEKEAIKRNDQIEQLTVQLSGCSVAALGGTEHPALPGDYGWSPAYQDVLVLRESADLLSRSFQNQAKELDRHVETLKASGDLLTRAKEALQKGHKEIQNLRGKLFEAVQRKMQVEKWLNDAAGLLNCDLDQVADAIRKLKQAW